MRRMSIICYGLTLTACVTTRTGYAPNLVLSTVQRPQDVAERWGEYTLAPADSSGFLYEDGLISLAVVPLMGSFSTVIKNKTEHSIRLLWAEASYVGPKGVATGVVPGETRWMDMGNVPGPQLIPSGAMASVTAIPKATANTSEMTIEGFYQRAASCDDIKNTELRLILPIEIQGVTNEYTLNFVPRNVELVVLERDALSGQTNEQSRTPCDMEDATSNGSTNNGLLEDTISSVSMTTPQSPSPERSARPTLELPFESGRHMRLPWSSEDSQRAVSHALQSQGAEIKQTTVPQGVVFDVSWPGDSRVGRLGLTLGQIQTDVWVYGVDETIQRRLEDLIKTVERPR